MTDWLIYGANGYTGELIAREAARRGMKPILAGRNERAIRKLGAELNLPVRIFGLDDPAKLAEGLASVDTVLHCAGPFVHTAAPMAAACLKARAHYLDITGEIAVFEAIARRDAEAREAGVCLIPGVGFDVVPTDCIAAKLSDAMADAVDLRLAHLAGGGLSRGTFKTMIEGLKQPGLLRRDGRIVPVPFAFEVREIEFSCGRRWAMTFPWGDVSTAYRTTGILDIRVYIGTPLRRIKLLKRLVRFASLLTGAAMKRLIGWLVSRTVSGPDEKARANTTSYLWGQVANEAGQKLSLTMETPNGYALTVTASLAAMERVRSGEVKRGGWTPARAFGSDFVDGLLGVKAGEIRTAS